MFCLFSGSGPAWACNARAGQKEIKLYLLNRKQHKSRGKLHKSSFKGYKTNKSVREKNTGNQRS